MKIFIAKHNETGLDTSLSYLEDSFKEQWLLDNPEYHEAVYELQEDGARYQAYLAEPDEAGVYQPDLSALQESLVASNVTTAKELRDSTIVSDIEVLGVVWQVDDKGRGSMDLAIEYASRNSIPAETTQGWRLADNSVRECTVADLNAVLNAYTERSMVVWANYNEWFLTDKLSEFTVL